MREIKFRVWDTEENKFFEPIYEAYKGNLLDLSISLNGRLLRRFESQKDAANHVNGVIQAFPSLKNGKLKTYKSYLWKFGI